ncbi:MAG: hypothetical protein KTR18_15555 [Acidiferrobacterales bacterium]|nr:hypothetical protein [Acidiferrobacterales bacterium]
MSLPVAPQLDFSEIPVIDIAPLLSGFSDTRVIKQIEDACRRVGFFYIENHRINPNTVSQICEQAKLFFGLPKRRKQSLLVNPQMRGYLPLDYRSFEGEDRAATSRQEGFWMGLEAEETTDRPLDGYNQWAQELPRLQPAMEQYYCALEPISQALMQGFARALGLNKETLLPLFHNPTTRLKLNHYPPQENPTDEHHIGVVPHTDSGAFTILWQDHHGGLEVMNKNGEWVGAPPIKDTFVVNLGNIMQIWSGGQFSSTKHRVINRGTNDRYSIPLFVNPDQKAVIENLVADSGCGEKGFGYGEYQSKFWHKAFPVAHSGS